jgi:uncharacterized protein
MAIAAFGATTAASYAMSGLVGSSDCSSPAACSAASPELPSAGSWHSRKRMLGTVFACLVIIVGVYVVSRGLVGLTA